MGKYLTIDAVATAGEGSEETVYYYSSIQRRGLQRVIKRLGC